MVIDPGPRAQRQGGAQRAQNREDGQQDAQEARDRAAVEELEALRNQLHDEDEEQDFTEAINLLPVLQGQVPAEGTRTQQRLQALGDQNHPSQLRA